MPTASSVKAKRASSPSGCLAPSNSSSTLGGGDGVRIGSPSSLQRLCHGGDAGNKGLQLRGALPEVHKPTAAGKKTSVPNPLAATAAPAASTATARPTSLEGLLNAKKIMLASVEAKFNEKIVMRHEELMAEQVRTLEYKNPYAKNHPLAKEVKRLIEQWEEQKISHEVELQIQKNAVKRLGEELEREKELKQEAVERISAVKNNASRVSEWDASTPGAAMKLEEELKREKHLRMDQLKSLELLHFAEFREIEKKHAEFVSHLVASYQNEIKVLKSELKTDHDIKLAQEQAPYQQQPESNEDSHEAAAAAAALSAMAGPGPAVATDELNDPSAKKDDNSTANVAEAMMPTEMPPLPPMPDAEDDTASKPSSDESTKKVDKKEEGKAAKGNAVHDVLLTSLKRDISEVSDSGSGNEEYKAILKRPRVNKYKQRIQEKVEEKVEEILKKSGKAPPSTINNKKSSSSDAKKKDKRILNDEVKGYLKAWMMHPDHCEHPYPSVEQKAKIMADTGMTFTEMNNWFVNNRKRFWQTEVKPKIAEIKKAHRMGEMRASYDALKKTDV